MKREIKLTKGYSVTVDQEDYETYSQYKWRAHTPYKDKVYACRTVKVLTDKGVKPKTILMHREIAQTPDGMMTDHIDGNTLNNCKENLRVCTHAENICNSKKITTPTSSKYKGVCWHKKDNNWLASIKHNQKTIRIGGYKEEKQAALAYNFKATELFGEFACLNKI